MTNGTDPIIHGRKSFGETVMEAEREMKMMSGVELIAAERERQIAEEGWTAEHDDEHIMGEMIGAAITYASHALEQVSNGEIEREGLLDWPWDVQWWKPSDYAIRNLQKAGALIAAEIDRLQREEAKHGSK